MANSSLMYEIALYINSFYFGLFATCELGTMVLKSVLIIEKYYYDDDGEQIKVVDPAKIGRDYGVLFALCVIEIFRLVLGRKGSLSERDFRVIFSVFLTVPSILLVLYLLIWQVVVLRIEYIWCSILLIIQCIELFYASMFVVTVCKGPSYD